MEVFWKAIGGSIIALVFGLVLEKRNPDVAVVLNVDEDHLDYFKTMKTYSKTKLSWFLSGRVKTSIVNIDDKYAQSLLSKKIQVLS